VEQIWKQREHGPIDVPPGHLKVKVKFTLKYKAPDIVNVIKIRSLE
jgi:hypothetical protein